jgi:SAM-dependent methyltransferase
MRNFYHRLFGRVLSAWGAPLMARLTDRRILERDIFLYIVAHPEFCDILWVGSSWYTAPYTTLFRDRNFWTLDIDPLKQRYGSARHIVDGMENVRRHFGVEVLDLVLCNGVVGWGFNSYTQVEQAFGGCFESLRPGGVLMIGWNDLPHARPIPFAELTTLARFEPYVFPPLHTHELRTRSVSRHVFTFYRKPLTTATGRLG